MEHFFEFETRDELPWFAETEALEVNQSAFKKYINQEREGFGLMKNNKKGNVKKRMVDFLKNRWRPLKIRPAEAEKERNRRHMIHERMRREKEKQNYMELHRLLPNGTKSDKNSIVQMAKKTIEDLERVKEELQKKNHELEMMMMASNAVLEADHSSKRIKMDEAKIKLRGCFPSSGIDSILEVLKCLKSTGSITKVIHSTFSPQEFSAVLHVETKIEATEVEKAVQRTLIEVERKIRSSFLEEQEL